MKAWNDFLKLQERELGIETVEKWLRTLRVVRFDACNLYLEAKDAFQTMWFEEHIRKKAQLSLVNNNQTEIKIHLSTANSNEVKAAKKKSSKTNTLSTSQTQTFKITFDDLDPLETFDNFVESESSVLAHKLLCKITNYDPISKTYIASETDLASFNPIYLFGGEGSGKTHLLMATAHALRSRNLKVVYVKAETFTEHVVTAIRSSEMSTFRLAYRNIDVLLIDDVHLFSRKGATQEELFHTFNTLHLAGKQIILSANCAPSELQNIEPRLVSRFEWGIVLPLEPLTEADIQKVLKKKAEALEIQLHPTVEQFLLATFINSTKSIMRGMETLVLRHYLKNEKQDKGSAASPITVQSAKYLLKDLIDAEEQDAITADKIINTVAEYFGIKVEDIFSKAQSRDCVLPRQLAMYFCRSKLKMPYKKIGELFIKDHSTVMSSVKLIEKNVESDDKEIMTPYLCILKKINR
jgi:chromosomal replication initiator protein